MRATLGLFAGIAAAIAAIMLVGVVGGLFFSIEAPTDPMQSSEVAASLSGAPTGTKITIILSWFVGGFVALAAAKYVARVSWPGWIVAGALALLLAGTFLVPLPMWMQALAVVGPLIGALLADLFIGGGTRADPNAGPERRGG